MVFDKRKLIERKFPEKIPLFAHLIQLAFLDMFSESQITSEILAVGRIFFSKVKTHQEIQLITRFGSLIFT